MKRALCLCLLAVGLFTLNACMFMGSEDREFYGKGWVNPKELDKQPSVPMPMHPETTGSNGPASGGGTDVVVTERTAGTASLDDGEWSTPKPH